MDPSKAEKKPQPKRKNCTTYKLVILALAVIILLLLLLRSCGTEMVDDPGPGPSPSVSPAPMGLIYDPDAVKGGWVEADPAALQAALNEKVAEGMVNISMNTTPVFRDGGSAGSLMIVNETVNRHPQRVEIRRNDTGEIIYKSGAIPVGSKIETAKLDIPLDAGSYFCTAYFYALDEETGSPLGCAGAVITITILN